MDKTLPPANDSARRPRVLVVDDEADIRELLDLTLARMGLDADCAASLAEARIRLQSGAYQLCLTDMRLPDGEGLTLVQEINQHTRTLPVAVITAHGNMENAVAALKAGAFDYLSKPVSLDQLRTLVRTALALPSSVTPADSAKGRLRGESPAMKEVRALIERVARSQAPVYLFGESGSGKELAARMIHDQGARRERPFIAVNCGAIPEALMESEFFGYRKGAFTGADADREGFFQAANGSTLFLDEVADLPLQMQVKLLRVIQEKRVRKVGSAQEEPVDVRILCATHQNLRERVEQGLFRQDLFYRLNVIEVRMPPLRECREDIPALVGHLIARLSSDANEPVPAIAPEAIRLLQAYAFPGNVRELENILERALALRTGPVIESADLLLGPAVPEVSQVKGEASAGGAKTLQGFLDDTERKVLRDALSTHGNNLEAAAATLGLSVYSLRTRLKRLDMPA